TLPLHHQPWPEEEETSGRTCGGGRRPAPSAGSCGICLTALMLRVNTVHVENRSAIGGGARSNSRGVSMRRVIAALAALVWFFAGGNRAPAGPLGFAVDPGSSLYSVDLGTATATLIGLSGFSLLEGLAISPSGQLFATSSVGNLYSINSLTGAATLIGNT